jgi:putative oxygen-independent coproporphyrinogen III oxidase
VKKVLDRFVSRDDRQVFMLQQSISVYIHWPFCKSKCPYCDFNSHVREQISHEEWQDAYLKEIRFFKEQLSGKHVKSIFFGGGTPSLAQPKLMELVIDELGKLATLDENVEITLEANPTSIEAQKFHDFKLAGINRVSVGIQSLNDESLKFLGREHSSYEAQKALEIAQNTFKRFTFDLIYALPNQSIESWNKELKQALGIAKKHLSLYQLTIEKGTRFYSDYRSKKFEMPSNDLAADMYEMTADIMEQNGTPFYEVSNYAAVGEESKHNLAYWQYKDYLGIGPGAHGRFSEGDEKFASQMIASPEQWLKSVNEIGVGFQRKDLLSVAQMRQEKLLMGMRLRDGVEEDVVINKSQIPNLVNQGLLKLENNRVIATRKGMLVLNSLIEALA